MIMKTLLTVSLVAALVACASCGSCWGPSQSCGGLPLDWNVNTATYNTNMGGCGFACATSAALSATINPLLTTVSGNPTQGQTNNLYSWESGVSESQCKTNPITGSAASSNIDTSCRNQDASGTSVQGNFNFYLAAACNMGGCACNPCQGCLDCYYNGVAGTTSGCIYTGDQSCAPVTGRKLLNSSQSVHKTASYFGGPTCHDLDDFLNFTFVEIVDRFSSIYCSDTKKSMGHELVGALMDLIASHDGKPGISCTDYEFFSEPAFKKLVQKKLKTKSKCTFNARGKSAFGRSK